MLKGVRVHEYLTRDLAKVREVVEGHRQQGHRRPGRRPRAPVLDDGPGAARRAPAGRATRWSRPRPALVIDPMKDARQEAKRQTQIFILRLTDLAKVPALRPRPEALPVLLDRRARPRSSTAASPGNPSSGAGPVLVRRRRPRPADPERGHVQGVRRLRLRLLRLRHPGLGQGHRPVRLRLR
ncbi:MAG: hypothetical protein MZV63_58565 [Marinilabiliales bacterium]|nr:hypothetical protein [Marinilabiliales bacterium]